jgi:hypothetical protein
MIRKNVDLEEGTFIMELHENSRFDCELLTELIADIVTLVQRSQDSLSDLEILNHFQGLFFLHANMSDSLTAHFNPNDSYRIENLDKNYYDYVKRFTFSMEMLLKRDFFRLKCYEDDLGSIV